MLGSRSSIDSEEPPIGSSSTMNPPPPPPWSPSDEVFPDDVSEDQVLKNALSIRLRRPGLRDRKIDSDSIIGGQNRLH